MAAPSQACSTYDNLIDRPCSHTSEIQAFFESCGIKTTEDIGDGHRRRAIVRVGFHSLRHTFVSLCAKAGAPLHVVQKLVRPWQPDADLR